MNQTVYVDVILAVNLVMDYMVLWAAGKLAGVKIVYHRILAASILGAVYSVGCLFSDLSAWYDFPVKVIISAIIVILAYWPSSGLVFVKVWGYFYGVSFAMAGAVVGASYIFQGFPLYAPPDFSYLWLGGGVVCAMALGTYGDRMMRERIVPGLLKCPVGLRFGSVWCQGQGFIDTGNNLTDPLTNKPVVVAEYQLISGCLPVDVREAVDYCLEEENLFEALAQTSWAHRLRLIPFTSIGKKHGLLVGLRSDELKIQAGNQWISYPGVVIGLYREPLSPEGGFQLLVPAAFVKQ